MRNQIERKFRNHLDIVAQIIEGKPNRKILNNSTGEPSQKCEKCTKNISGTPKNN